MLKNGILLALGAFFIVFSGPADAKLRATAGAVNTVSDAQNIFIPSENTCTTDVTSELEAFASAHSGRVVLRPGDCLKVGDAGHNIASTSDLLIHCPINQACELRSDNDDNVILYDVPDNVAYDSQTAVSAISNPATTAINKDDKLTRITVASVSGYSVGDYVKIINSVSLPSRLKTVRNGTTTVSVSGVASSGSVCTITTNVAHGFSSSQKIFIKGVTATVGGTAIDYIDGSDGLGRLYNITVTGSTTFTLQTIDNATDTNSGSNVDCATGTYASGGSVTRQNGWVGESNQVAGIDTVNKYIYLTHRLKYPSLYVVDTTTGNVPQLYRYTKARKFSISGVKVTAGGNTQDVTLTTSDPAIEVRNVPDAAFNDVYCENTWDACIIRKGTPNSIARNITSYKMPNRGTYDSSGNTYTITGITAANPAVFTYYNTDGSSGLISSNTELGLSSLPSGWTSLQGTLYRVASPSAGGNTCTNSGDTCTFQLVDTYGNAVSTSGFTPAYSGTSGAGVTSDVTGLGYTISDYGTNFGSVVSGIESWNGRHTTTTDGAQQSWGAVLSASSTVGLAGQPTYLTVENGVAHGAWGVPWDTHEEAADIHYRNISTIYPIRGVYFGSYAGGGLQIRGKDVTVDGYRQVGGRNGIRVVATEHDSVSVNRYNNIDLSDLVAAGTTVNTSCSQSSTGYDVGMLFCSNASNTNIPINLVTNYRTRNVSYPISAFEKSKVTVTGAQFRDYQAVLEKFAGSKVTFRDVVADLSTNTHTSSYNYIAGLRSDGTNDTGNELIVQGLRIVKGSNADYPRHIVDEKDTTATKYYWMAGIQEQNDSAVTATALLESGASTLSELTTMSLLNATKDFNRLDPLTTKGDLLVNNGSDTGRLAVGTDGKIVIADSNSTNGLAWFDSPLRPNLQSSRYLIPNLTGVGTSTVNLNTMVATPVYVKKRTTFTHAVFAPTSATTALYKQGVYVDNGGVPGALVAGSEVTTASTTVASATNTETAFGTPITLDPGWYWIAIVSDTTTTMNSVNSTSLMSILGTADLTTTGVRVARSFTYGSLPDPFGAATFSAGSTPLQGLKVQ